MAKEEPFAEPGSNPKGNYIAEWFGYRVWPDVDRSENAQRDQSGRLCPFLTNATRRETRCIKAARGYDEPTGVCTISSDSNGSRQDWLACPFRILDQHFTILGGAIRTLFRIERETDLVLLPTSVLNEPQRKSEVQTALVQRKRVFAFCGNKLGGEVDVPETEASPGGKVDTSVIEILGCDPKNGKPIAFGKHLFFEIQTADFHGSPLHAVRLLAQKSPAGGSVNSHDLIAEFPGDCGSKVEGPNKANIFKRTIYQMVLKMELAREDNCAGFAIILPVPVWESWLRHLGRPTLEMSAEDPSVFLLHLPETVSGDTVALSNPDPTWVFVFDIDRDSEESPRPLKIVYRLQTPPRALLYYAFEAAPKYAIESGAMKKYRQTLIKRVTDGWAGKEPAPDDNSP